MAQKHDNKIPVYETLPFVKSDMLPEGAKQTKDTGCSLAPSCFSCPFPVCRYDPEFDVEWAMSKSGIRVRQMKQRDAQIVEMVSTGAKVPIIAGRFNVAIRTVYRIIDRVGAVQ